MMKNTTIEKTLKSVEEAYISQKYDEAIDALVESKSSIPAPLFHYNLGSLYLKKGSLGAARYNLEKAIKDGFSGTEVYKNLSVVRKNREIVDLSNSSNVVDNSLATALRLPTGSYLSLSLLLTMIILLLGRFRIIMNKWILGSLILLSLTPFMLEVFYFSRINEAVIIRTTGVYEGPSDIFNENFKLVEGSKVILGKKNEGWALIERPLEVSGWIKIKDLGFF